MNDALQTVQNYIDPIRRRYDSLEEMERWVVNGIVVLLVLVLVCLVLIVPAKNSLSEAEMKLAAQQNLMQWMQQNEPAARLAARGGSSTVGTDQPLQSIVTSTAPSMGVTVKRFEPESDDKLRVWLENVSFDKTARWLHQLENRYGVRIVNISVDAEREQGLINAKLVLNK
ncbi:type II secretion system protein M [Ketobacter sp. MCCC 1A13808]|uniref:type II secretion system protein GspM n=1 Tax=Ketobacter sp. MCCC 1A13808 TaxID=2602738 RepID=UPI0012EB3344|nr:type II secretion system protein M [Ketobacter sp. MCCC 1A13808]MVF10521.1 type II secretion system protein M [Ketobacter sp. MCCC 1A13808]